MRVGMGYDVHRLTEGRDLILGGVKDRLGERPPGTFRCRCTDPCSYGCTSGSSSTGRYRKNIFPWIQTLHIKGFPVFCCWKHVTKLLREHHYGDRKYRCNDHCTETKDGTSYSTDESQYGESNGNQ